MSTALIALLVILGVVVVALLWFVGIYNGLVRLRNEVKNAWAQIDVQLKRRHDLIPNLVETVKGYAAQEKGVLVEVTEARASATQVKVDASTLTDPAKFAQYSQAQDKLSGVLGRLMMIQESYPNLKSNENFMALQSQLEGTENRITISRRDYNEAVRDYNLEFKLFPNSLWAMAHQGSKPMEMFSASAQAQSAPSVSFAPTAPAVAPGSAPPK